MRPIHSVVRCLDVLRELNLRNGATVHELANFISMPRQTIYRMLETLLASGYVRRDAQTGGYWLVEKINELSDGYEDMSWVFDVGATVIYDLKPKIRWCLSLCTPDETDMIARVSTRLRNPGESSKTFAGERHSMAESVDGHVYLAFCSTAVRNRLLQRIYATEGFKQKKGSVEAGFVINRIGRSQQAAHELLEGIRKQGYSLEDISLRTGAISVPVFRDGEIAGALHMAFWLSSMKHSDILSDFLPRLLEASHKISSEPAQSAPPRLARSSTGDVLRT